MELISGTGVRPSRGYLPPGIAEAAATAGLFTEAALSSVHEFFDRRPDLAPTPLRPAAELARSIGLGHVWLKDETDRFGLPAFKGLGTHFAIAQLAELGRLHAGATLVCASEGNHGRAVARAARGAGLAARVYVGARVAESRVEAIREEGATVVRTAGTYDEAIRTVSKDAAAHGWIVVSDTGWPGYDEIPGLIMLGYSHMMTECEREWGDAPPDLVVVQGGVGGLAGGVAGWWAGYEGPRRPRLVCVEPLAAACLQTSARRGSPTPVAGPLDTIMGGLRCGEVSTTAFPTVAASYDAYLAIDDEWAREGMRRLAAPRGADPRIEAGPSGAAGVAALLALAADPGLRSVREALGWSPTTRALAIVTEGVTEPELFRRVVGDG